MAVVLLVLGLCLMFVAATGGGPITQALEEDLAEARRQGKL